jgi:hypothetical protein
MSEDRSIQVTFEALSEDGPSGFSVREGGEQGNRVPDTASRGRLARRSRSTLSRTTCTVRDGVHPAPKLRPGPRATRHEGPKGMMSSG